MAESKQDLSRGRIRGAGQSHQSLGAPRLFFLSFLFSLCLLQDLKGQPRPRRGARWPPFLRSPDALCGPAGPACTRSTGSRPPGIFRFTRGPGQQGGRAWLDRPGARLFLQSPVGGGNKTTQQVLSHPKAGSKKWGREVSQILSEFPRTQKDTSPTRETTSLQHSRAPKSLRATRLRGRSGAGLTSLVGVPSNPHRVHQGPAPGHGSHSWTAWKIRSQAPRTQRRSQGAGPNRAWLRPITARPRPRGHIKGSRVSLECAVRCSDTQQIGPFPRKKGRGTRGDVSAWEGRREWSRARQHSGRRFGPQQARAHRSYFIPLPLCNSSLCARGRPGNFCPPWQDLRLYPHYQGVLSGLLSQAQESSPSSNSYRGWAYLSSSAPGTGKQTNPSFLSPSGPSTNKNAVELLQSSVI